MKSQWMWMIMCICDTGPTCRIACWFLVGLFARDRIADQRDERVLLQWGEDGKPPCE